MRRKNTKNYFGHKDEPKRCAVLKFASYRRDCLNQRSRPLFKLGDGGSQKWYLKKAVGRVFWHSSEKKIMAIFICSGERAKTVLQAKTIICFVLTPIKDRFRAGARMRALAPNRPSGVLGKYHTNGACG